MGSAEEEEKSTIDCPMSYALIDEKGGQVAAGEGKGAITREYLTISPKFGNILPFHLRDIDEIIVEGYRINLPLFSSEKLILSNLGHCFEDFARTLSYLRNEVIISDLLMNETIRNPDVEMEFAYLDEKGNEVQRGAGKVRLYETGLLVIPQRGEILRVPYGDVVGVSEEGHGVKIGTEFGEQFLFQKMGAEFDPFLRKFSDVQNELRAKEVSSVKALFPAIDSVSLRRVAAIVREGKAAKRAEIEAISPRLWQELEKRIASAGLNESYTFLKELGRQERIAIGFKRGLIGDLTGEYIWFLVPIYGDSEKGYGNALCMEAAEATGEEASGKATYFFRMGSRKEYSVHENAEQLDIGADNLIKTVSRCMLDINFRREPIYLQDEVLNEPDYVKYRVAVRRIPSLGLLRELFIGRVIHSSPEQWRNDVMDLLKFNMATRDDSVKWRR
ncbi:MAG TPA: hypothetical protein VJ574_05535 [Candidatus Bathyarchaeia archaeon]|nr:MAG: hypothetical protein A3K70_00890 [Candidatus Bathyarchaeota archaeon RBG_16_48_13]HJX23851.1 hypothetical protein [Candidatus Bathyarchaeia archaeon]